MYKVLKSDLKGDLKEFPIEIAQKLIEKQIKARNKQDISVFQKNISASTNIGGFNWATDKKVKNNHFWYDVLMLRNFDLFFSIFPKPNYLNEVSRVINLTGFGLVGLKSGLSTSASNIVAVAKFDTLKTNLPFEVKRVIGIEGLPSPEEDVFFIVNPDVFTYAREQGRTDVCTYEGASYNAQEQLFYIKNLTV